MSTFSSTALAPALAALAPPGVRVAHRRIREGDEAALLPVERAGRERAVAAVLRQSGAARMVARELLAAFGAPDAVLPRGEHGPVWPPGIVGSLAHDREFAVAAVAARHAVRGLGIDIEPAEPLPDGLVTCVTTEAERRRYPLALLQSRLFFVVKEAVYKALNPLDGRFLGFDDVDIDLDAGVARAVSGASARVRFALVPRVIAIAYVPTD